MRGLMMVWCNLQPNGAAAGAGHAVLPPPEVILAEDNQPLPNVYGNITGAHCLVCIYNLACAVCVFTPAIDDE